MVQNNDFEMVERSLWVDHQNNQQKGRNMLQIVSGAKKITEFLFVDSFRKHSIGINRMNLFY